MFDIITLVSFALQLWSMWWPSVGRVRTSRTVTGEFEVNLGFIRYRMTWSQRRHAQR
jgi:hypothetical protein